MKHRNESGTMVAWLLATMFLVLGAGGMAVDTWLVIAERRSLATVVDAAAAAGASAIDLTEQRATGKVLLDVEEARSRAVASYATSGAGPPPTVDVAADGSQVTVTGTRDVDFVLLPLLGVSGRTITVTAAAGPEVTP